MQESRIEAFGESNRAAGRPMGPLPGRRAPRCQLLVDIGHVGRRVRTRRSAKRALREDPPASAGT